MTYANIIVDISHEKLDKPFQYRIPEELEGKLLPGMVVEIPFGRGDRLIKGLSLWRPGYGITTAPR